jgi:hypothetical protein
MAIGEAWMSHDEAALARLTPEQRKAQRDARWARLRCVDDYRNPPRTATKRRLPRASMAGRGRHEGPVRAVGDCCRRGPRRRWRPRRLNGRRLSTESADANGGVTGRQSLGLCRPPLSPKVTAMSLTRTRLARVRVAIAAAAALTVGLVASSGTPVSADGGSVSGGGSPGEDHRLRMPARRAGGGAALGSTSA